MTVMIARLARFTAHIGDGQYIFGVLGMVYLLGWRLDNPLLRRNMLTIALVILAAGIVTTLIKFAVRRRRPQPPGEFVSLQYDKYSFPSGHSARMATLVVMTMFMLRADHAETIQNRRARGFAPHHGQRHRGPQNL